MMLVKKFSRLSLWDAQLIISHFYGIIISSVSAVGLGASVPTTFQGGHTYEGKS